MSGAPLEGFRPEDPNDPDKEPAVDPQTGTPEPTALDPSVDGTPTPDDDKDKEVPVRVDDRRNEIYENAKANRGADAAENAETSEEAQRLAYMMELESQGLSDEEIQQAVMEQFQDTTNPLDAEARDNPPPADPEPGADPQPGTGSEEVDTEPEYVKITVNGEEQWATYAEVDEAGGVEQLQKDRAARLVGMGKRAAGIVVTILPGPVDQELRGGRKVAGADAARRAAPGPAASRRVGRAGSR